MLKDKKVKAWYFSSEDKKLRYDDGRTIEEGIIHGVEGLPSCCEHGLHASRHVADALEWAPGPILWRVTVSGQIEEQEDKLCGNSREYHQFIDATEVLRKYARMCALDVLHLWDAPDVVVQYLKTGDGELRAAARAAAWDAARAAAWGAARTAARDAAWDAARAAAWGAARTAARDAARDAARAAAWDAARKKQRTRFARLVTAEFKKKYGNVA